jgi:4-alpha-glucanotransferase
MKQRGSGILMHLTSLPSPFGIGDMGRSAYRFIDFLSKAKQRYWQILPLNPTEPAHDNSPYYSISAFAGNPLLISPELLVKEGLLPEAVLTSPPDFPKKRVRYRPVIAHKKKLFNHAYNCFKTRKNKDGYERFCRENAEWLDDFVLFKAFKFYFKGGPWRTWIAKIRDRDTKALKWAEKKLPERIEKEKFLQYLFAEQWRMLKAYCNQKGIHIIGDIPIYMPYESSDIWAHPELFKLDHNKKPYAVAGVPPDYFSASGQLWGHPVYRWEVLKKTGYDWWIKRIKRNLALFDFVRIDHFRGFVAYWEVPAAEKTAINGKWVEAPAVDFFEELGRKFSCLPIIAEDLGTITADVREVIHQFGFPGMKLLLFAFGDDFPSGAFLPHNLVKNSLAYTGTHDNNTVRGWLETEAKPEEKKRLFTYLGRRVTADELPWEMIRLLMMSVANTIIIPIQDIFGLGAEARMNRPASKTGNWQWRLTPELLTSASAEKLLEMTETYQRA